jgi:hypothetical protein
MRKYYAINHHNIKPGQSSDLGNTMPHNTCSNNHNLQSDSNKEAQNPYIKALLLIEKSMNGLPNWSVNMKPTSSCSAGISIVGL